MLDRFTVVRDGRAVAIAIDFGTKAVLNWFDTALGTLVYGSMTELREKHETTGSAVVDIDSDWFARAIDNAALSRCENAPFGDIGGLGNRSRLAADDPTICPDYVPLHHRGSYLSGYRCAALLIYGADWETCEFSWYSAVTIARHADG